MSIHNAVIATASDEKTFISAFIKSVMNEAAFVSEHTLSVKINDDTIQTSADVDTVLDSNWSSTPAFSFTIDTHSTLTFTRPSALTGGSSTANAYIVSALFGGITHTRSSTPHSRPSFTSSSVAPTSITTRCWKYQIFSNANVLYIVFGEYNEELPLSNKKGSQIKTFQAFSYKKNSDWLGGGYAEDILFGTLGNTEIMLVNRLPYTNNSTDPTAIEVIQNKVAATNAGQERVMTMDNIWDSTYNSAVMFPVSINNNSYVYLNNYTLMSV